ncbi:traB family protein [Wolffia australiana]
MESIPSASSFSLWRPNSANFRRRSSASSPVNAMASIRPPPVGFDYKLEVQEDTRAAVARFHPELIDLVENGDLVLVEKRRFGPVPSWRSAFVEPEAIWLVGTSHVSARSAAEVERVIKAVAPDNVVVELCRSRAGIMYASDDGDNSGTAKSSMFSLTGSKFLGAVGRSLDLGGQTALALRLLLAVYSSKISSGSKQTFGDEFRAARRVSEEIGAQLVLGDRPIEITLQRAWRSLNWNQKLNLISSLFQGISSPSVIGSPETFATSNLLEKEEDASPFKLYEQLSLTYPSLLQPLIHERDTYLSWSLKRSKAVCNSKRVVGVIGKGHMNGVVYALVSDLGDLRFRDLTGGSDSGSRSNGWAKEILVGLLRDTVIGVILLAIYEIFQHKP